MLDATTVMKQAGMTAHDWMIEAKSFVEDHFAEYPPSAKAQLISAYVMAAAGDELAMYVRCVVEEFGGPLRAIANHFEADWPTRR